jgi:hypothetical protein
MLKCDHFWSSYVDGWVKYLYIFYYLSKDSVRRSLYSVGDWRINEYGAWVQYKEAEEEKCKRRKCYPLATTNLSWAGWQSKLRIWPERHATDGLSYDNFSYLTYSKINHAGFESDTVGSAYKECEVWGNTDPAEFDWSWLTKVFAKAELRLTGLSNSPLHSRRAVWHR